MSIIAKVLARRIREAVKGGLLYTAPHPTEPDTLLVSDGRFIVALPRNAADEVFSGTTVAAMRLLDKPGAIRGGGTVPEAEATKLIAGLQATWQKLTDMGKLRADLERTNLIADFGGNALRVFARTDPVTASMTYVLVDEVLASIIDPWAEFSVLADTAHGHVSPTAALAAHRPAKGSQPGEIVAVLMPMRADDTATKHLRKDATPEDLDPLVIRVVEDIK